MTTSTKLKVAFFAEILISDFDGASRTMYQLINRIPREDFEFRFYCGMPPEKDIGFDVVELPTVQLPFNESYRAVFPHFSKRKIRKAIDDFQPDVIHIASPSPLGNLAADYARKNNIPVLSIYHTHFITYMKYYFRSLPFLTPLAYRYAVKMTRDFYRKIDLVYTPTKQIIQELKEICKLPGDNLKLWQRGMDQDLFKPEKRDVAYLQNITGNTHPNLLFASRLVWEKNLQKLLDLYDLVQSQGQKLNFIIAGDGNGKAEAERKMPQAHFLGMLSHADLAKVYASSDVYFFPSDTETYGNVIIEAMASGLPCVAADGGGPKSLITDGENGFLCPVNDTEYYLEKINLILEDEALRKRIIEAGLAFTRPLNWDNLASIYFEDLRKLKAQKA